MRRYSWSTAIPATLGHKQQRGWFEGHQSRQGFKRRSWNVSTRGHIWRDPIWSCLFRVIAFPNFRQKSEKRFNTFDLVSEQTCALSLMADISKPKIRCLTPPIYTKEIHLPLLTSSRVLSLAIAGLDFSYTTTIGVKVQWKGLHIRWHIQNESKASAFPVVAIWVILERRTYAL